VDRHDNTSPDVCVNNLSGKEEDLKRVDAQRVVENAGMSALEQIHVTRWGKDDGERVVLVHGGASGGPAGGASQFVAQRTLAAEGYALILPDRPGHGLSPARGRDDFEADAVWTAELLDDRAHLVGHSYGAAVTLACAARAPDRVQSLTLIEAPVFSASRSDPGAQRLALALADAISQPDELLTILAFVKAAGIPVGLLRPSPDPGQLMAMARALKAMRDPVTWEAGPSVAAVAAAGIPALIVTGGWSPGFEAIGDALAVQLAARRVVIDAGHHLPHLAVGSDGGPPGAEFNAALLAFLRGLR
jgi:pimeloyl-ACP methyl ester carboxylesterase